MIGVSSGIVIGIPVTAFLANTFSYEAAMGFFILMNVLAFLGTLRFFPAMPVTQAASIGSQLGVLKKAKTWVSLFVVSSVGAALFTVYAYISSFLLDVTKLTSSELSIALFVFGISSIAGNYVGGGLLLGSFGFAAIFFGGIGFLALTFAAVVLRVVRYERRDAAPAEVVEA